MKDKFQSTEEGLIEDWKKDYCSFKANYLLGSHYENHNLYFESIVHFKRALFQLDEGEDRRELLDRIDRIEYREYDYDTINKMSQHKNQVREYAKAQLLNPKTLIDPKQYITTENPIKNQPMKILYGGIEIANTMSIYTDSLRKRGYQAFCMNLYPSYLNYRADYSFNIRECNWVSCKDRVVNLVAYMISEFDIFHFFFNITLMPDYSDIYVLKALNKKMIMNNVGSDVRQYSKAIRMNSYWNLVKDTYFKRCSEERNINRIKLIAGNIDYCMTFDGELIQYVQSYYKKCFLYRIPINIDLYSAVDMVKKDRLLIVHAPTNPVVKGSKYIIETIEALKSKYDIEFVLIKHMSHERAKAFYKQADIIIDQIIIGEYGSLAVECMAMAKPVVCWICDYSKERYPIDLPIVSGNKDNLYEKLEMLILDFDMRKKLGLEGRNYVEKYHDINKLIMELIDIYNEMMGNNQK